MSLCENQWQNLIILFESSLISLQKANNPGKSENYRQYGLNLQLEENEIGSGVYSQWGSQVLS